jgi:hypothetical protein
MQRRTPGPRRATIALLAGLLLATTPSVADPDDAKFVDDVLEKYRSAYNRLDAAAAKTIWPTVDVKALARAFDRLESQTIAFKHCVIAVDRMTAAATCTGDARYVPRVGRKNVQSEPREWRFKLRRVDEAWVIASVEIR